VLVAAEPGAGLPQLQASSFGFAGLGYGDYFAAGVVGGVLALQRGWRWQVVAALAMLVVSLAWDQLFLVVDTLPATVPPAVVLLGAEAVALWPRLRSARAAPRPSARPSG